MSLSSTTGSRVMLMGGEAFPQRRYVYWNFVSSSRERIEQAKADWARDRFGSPVPGESEWIPLPEKKVVRAGEGAPTS
jgi:hypothetical protein